MRKYKCLSFIVLFICPMLSTVTCAKTKLFDSTEPGYWGVQIENDVLANGDDRFYTNAFR